jgi:hypothetical protein
MSQVISFRLDPENLREEIALQILKNRQEKGYSIRIIMTEALLKLGSAPDIEIFQMIARLDEKLDEINRLIQFSCVRQPVDHKPTSEDDSTIDLSEGFMTSIKIAVKPGIRLD